MDEGGGAAAASRDEFETSEPRMEEPARTSDRASQTILTSARSLARVSLGASKSTALMRGAASESRSLAEIPRRISSNSAGAPSASTAPRETVTLTLDYENLPHERNNDNNNEDNIVESDVVVVNDAVPSNDSAEIGSSRRDANTNSPPPTICSFADYRRRIPRNRWSLFCWAAPRRRHDDLFQESDTRAPPAYSALFPRYGRASDDDFQALIGSDRAAVLINGSPSSFVAPTPPPSYAQAQGICVAYSLEQLISNSASNGRFWTPRPTTAVCPRCATLVITVVHVQQAATTHLTALALCLMGCWPCCMLPYYIDNCKTSHHYCPFCRSYLGTYLPW